LYRVVDTHFCTYRGGGFMSLRAIVYVFFVNTFMTLDDIYIYGYIFFGSFMSLCVMFFYVMMSFLCVVTNV
jgi:hypothetical protein